MAKLDGTTGTAGLAAVALLVAVAFKFYNNALESGKVDELVGLNHQPPPASKQDPSGAQESITTTASPSTKASTTAGVPLPAKSDTIPPFPRYENVTDRSQARIFSVEELAAHNGDDRSKPLLLAILGDVFDVGPGERFYAPNQGYGQMGGKDSSRSFVDLEETGRTSSLEGLPANEIAEVMRWRNEFYRPHKEYRFVGVLHDRYYDEKGEPTPELKKLERMRKGAANADVERKQLETRFKSCNSKTESGKPNQQFWCDDSYHQVHSRPLHLYFRLPAAVEGEEQEKGSRCACVPPLVRADVEAGAKELYEKAPGDVTTFKFVDYVDCQSSADPQRCDRPKGSKPPPEDQ